MRAALLITLVAFGSFAQGRFDRVNKRTDQGRSKRGFLPQSGAFFEFAPASGAGMGTACACTTPTGAKGETMTFTRTGDATCSKQGLATTGIANGDLVVCTANQPRVESSGGVLGLRVEGARTNVLPRFINPCDAAWADVGTPALTGQVVSGTACPTTTPQASPWTGTYANAAVEFNDNDGAGFEGRTQTVTVTAATQYAMSCFVKAGTLNTARLSLDGTTADFTGLSSTTWTLATVVDASSSGVAIAAQALNGSTAAATGTVIWGGCQVEAGAYVTSIIPTVAAAVARSAEAAYLTMTSTQVGSMAATGQVPYPSSAAVGSNRRFVRTDVGGSDTNRYELYWASNATVTAGVVVGGVGGAIPTTALQTVPGAFRVAAWRTPGSTAAVIIGGTQTTVADAQAAFPDMNRVYLGVYAPSAGFEIDGIVSQVQVDPSTTRAR